MVSKKALTAISGAAIAALVLAGCATGDSGSGSPDSEETFDVVSVAALTGPLSTSAQGQVDGMTAAVESINEQGGILGRKVTLTVIDDQLDPTKSVSLLQEYLDKNQPELVIHGQTSNQALAMLPLLTRHEVLSIGQPQSSETTNTSKFPYSFSINSSTHEDAVRLVEELEKRGVKKAAFITANDALGQDMVNVYSELIGDAGIEFVVEQFAPTDMSMTGQLQRLQLAEPDILIPAAYGAAAGHLLASRTQLGWDIPMLGATMLGNGNNLGQISSEADWENLELLIFSANTDQRVASPAYEELLERLNKAGSKLDTLMQHYTLQWDALHLAKLAAEQAGSIKGPDMAKALENLDTTEEASQLLSFSEMRYSADNHFLNLDGVDDGYVVIKPGPVVHGIVESVE